MCRTEIYLVEASFLRVEEYGPNTPPHHPLERARCMSHLYMNHDMLVWFWFGLSTGLRSMFTVGIIVMEIETAGPVSLISNIH